MQLLNKFKLEYFHDLEDVLNQPDLLSFNMKVSTAYPVRPASSSDGEAANFDAGSGGSGLAGYRLERYFCKQILASGENGLRCTPTEDAIFKRLADELASPGTVLLFHDDKGLVKMEQTDNVFKTLKGYTDRAKQEVEATLSAGQTAAAITTITATVATVAEYDDEAITDDAAADDDETTPDDVEAGETTDEAVRDDALDEADVADTVNTLEETDGTTELEEGVEGAEPLEDNAVDNVEDSVAAELHTLLYWQYAIIFLTANSDDIELRYLYDAAVRAGRYNVLLAHKDTAASGEAALTVDTDTEENVPEETAETVTESEVAANTADTEGTETEVGAEGTEYGYLTPETSPESTDAVSAVSSISASDKLVLVNTAIFITRYLLYCEVFVLKTAIPLFAASLPNRINRTATPDLTGTKLYLTNRGKDVNASGVLMSAGLNGF